MNLWNDPRVRLPEEVAVGMARVAGGMVERLLEVAVSSGLAVVSVGTGRLMPDGCRDLGESEPENVPRYRVAA